MPSEDVLVEKLSVLGAELDARAEKFGVLESYRSGERPVPDAVVRANATTAYRQLMSVAPTNYAQLIVRAAASKLEVSGVKSGDDSLDASAWGVWQENRLDAEFRRATDSVLTHGRVFATVRPGDPEPEVVLDDARSVVVEYEEGSRYRRACALRRWQDDDDGFTWSTLYFPDGTYRFRSSKTEAQRQASRLTSEDRNPALAWQLEETLENSFGLVPVCEIATNGGLVPGRFGSARGDYEGALALLDRINTLEFLRLVIAFTASFPVRAVIGDKILRDDDGKPIAPFNLGADVVAQFEDPNVRLDSFQAADLKSFGEAIDHDIDMLAGVTQTPAYYLRSVPIQNVSADTIRASNIPLDARVADHQPFISEGLEEVLRVAMVMKGQALPQSASVEWLNRESYSLSERADAATKLKDILPWQVIAGRVLDMNQEEINRVEQLRAADALTGLLTEPDAVPSD